jgi:hypothetical protein
MDFSDLSVTEIFDFVATKQRGCPIVLDSEVKEALAEIRQRMSNDPKTKRYGPGEKISLQKFSENSSRSSQAKR